MNVLDYLQITLLRNYMKIDKRGEQGRYFMLEQMQVEAGM
jgi:hypothetical protein